LLQLREVAGWVCIHDLCPCQGCGGSRFAVGRWRLFCPACLKAKPDERIRGFIEVPAIIAELSPEELAVTRQMRRD
jgi:hypothetical protein